MSRSEFRWNKKRKHYAYLFKIMGTKIKNILISSKSVVIRKKHGKTTIKNNVPLVRHPNKKKSGKYFLIVRIYIDDESSFDELVYTDWVFDINDKRKVKRIKKGK